MVEFDNKDSLHRELRQTRESLDALEKDRAEGRSDAYANGWAYLNHELDDKILKESQRAALLRVKLLKKGWL